MNTIAFYDTKPYDREYFESVTDAGKLSLQFHEFRLSTETVSTAGLAKAVCVFVNDRLDAACLSQLRSAGVLLVA
jgi:D-lactate dehydrogenase